MTGNASLDATYFDGIFVQDDDPWGLASSEYEAAKYAETIRVLADRRYTHAFEVGCAHGVLTQKISALCDHLLSVDISRYALDRARQRLGEAETVTFRQMTFPKEAPTLGLFDLVVLSEVAYYWDIADLQRAGVWLQHHVTAGGQVLLVHYTGETDYPQTGDEAVAQLRQAAAGCFKVTHAARYPGYRLDLWSRT